MQTTLTKIVAIFALAVCGYSQTHDHSNNLNGGNISTTAVASGNKTGNGTKYATGTGSYVSGHCVSIDSGGNLIDNGSTCAAGTVTTVTGNSPISSSGGTTPAISCTGCVTASSPGAGLARFAGSTQAETSAELSGDATTSGSNGVTVVKVHGVTYDASPATDTVPIVTASNTATYKAIGDCQDATGNHLNYTASTHTISCGTSAGASGGGGATSTQVNTVNTNAIVNLNDTTPVSSAGSGYDNSKWQVSSSGGTSNVSVQSAIFSHNYKWAGTSATGSGSISFGDDSGSGTATGNPSVGDASNSAFSQFNTSTTNNSSGNASGQASWRVGHNLYLWARLKISSTTAVRYAFGFESNSNGGAGGSFNATTSDTFNGLFYVGFLYSTTLGHTQWQCVKNNQTSNITVATGPTTAPDTTAWHVYEVIEESSGTFGCYIDGVKIANSIVTGITAGTPLNANVSVVCLTCTPTANNIKFNKIVWAATY